MVSESPSLGKYPSEVVGEAYEAARLKAVGETGLVEHAFPMECPFSMERLLDLCWLPDAS